MIKYWRLMIYVVLALCSTLIGYIFLTRPPAVGIYNQVSHQINDNAQTVKLLAVGDISLSRNVAAQIDGQANLLLPFSSLAQILLSTNFNFGNLESPFSGKDSYPPTGSLIFNSPPKNIAGLKKYNFKILNLANNHFLDQGEAGLKYTLSFLADNGLSSIGAGLNLETAWKPVVITINNIKIAFIGASYASINDGGVKSNNYLARIEDLNQLKQSLNNAKQQADIIIVSMHAGIEYTRQPNQKQIDFAHSAIDNGADIVIGHHPHWIQKIELYNKKYIFYSLGNFIFDQMWSQETKEGLALLLQINKSKDSASLDSIELIPVIIENYSTPRRATNDEITKILKKIGWIDGTIINSGQIN